MTTPILPGFYPDPSICVSQGRYLIANSTFQYLPGVPIHASDDLHGWHQIGNAFDRAEQLDLTDTPSNAGLYAPTIRCHGRRFYLVTSDLLTARDGHLIIHTDDPVGPWSTPVRTPGAIGIDPDLFWDNDGICHLSWKGQSESGLTGILSAPIDPDSGKLLGEVHTLWQGSGAQASPEGPHLYHRNGYYYCLLAEGGTERTHSATIARATDLHGPWEPHPHNPILTHRGTDSPVQNIGHVDLLNTGNDTWIAVYLGVRPRGFTPKFHVNGRETFLAAVSWVDDWPIIGDPLPADTPDTGFVDEFTGPDLHPRWISHAGLHRRLTTATDRPGLTVRAHPHQHPIPALCVRARDNSWRASATVTGDAALQVHMDTRNWAEVLLDDTTVSVRLSTVGIENTLISIARPPQVEALAVTANQWPAEQPLNAGPDQLAFAIDTPTGAIELTRIDGRLLSTEVTAGFTGRTIGIRATNTPIQLHRFSYHGC